MCVRPPFDKVGESVSVILSGIVLSDEELRCAGGVSDGQSSGFLRAKAFGVWLENKGVTR